MSPTRRVMILVLAVVALAAVAWLLPLRSVQAGVGSLGLIGPVAAVALGAALLVALVPRTPVSLACGLLFGAGLGTACALALAVIAAVVTFGAGRWLGQDFVSRYAGRRWHTLERWIAGGGVLAVAATRSFPLGPYGLTGYAYGASAVRFRHYAVGTLIAAAPSAVTYAMVGAAVASPTGTGPLALIPLVFGLVVSTIVVLRARRSAQVAQIGEAAQSAQALQPARPAEAIATR